MVVKRGIQAGHKWLLAKAYRQDKDEI